MTQLIIPEMGGSSQAEVIEILIQEGDSVVLDQSTLVLESEKATIEVPADKAGTITKLMVKVGDKFSGGEAYAALEEALTAAAPVSATPISPPPSEQVVQTVQAQPETNTSTVPTPKVQAETAATATEESVYAGPAVRQLARELGVMLHEVKGTGLRQRIQKEDVHNFVKQRLQSGQQGSGSGIPAVPEIDFSQFGTVHEEPLNNIKRATAKAMIVAHLNVPQVTHFDLADITELEEFRIKQNELHAAAGIKFSIVPFIMKALVKCLQEYPHFNASLNVQGDALIVKEYIHMGVAVDTPKGLLVPVIQNVDQKTVTQIRQELNEKAHRAREGKLSLSEMQGACFSVSSLGGIGGTGFTPIVNPPEVAILGLSKASVQPAWNGKEFVPRLMLPLSLSYDHRVIDGAEAARFSQKLVNMLEDIRSLIM